MGSVEQRAGAVIAGDGDSVNFITQHLGNIQPDLVCFVEIIGVGEAVFDVRAVESNRILIIGLQLAGELHPAG